MGEIVLSTNEITKMLKKIKVLFALYIVIISLLSSEVVRQKLLDMVSSSYYKSIGSIDFLWVSKVL